MNIFMTGGTGFVGTFLSKELALAGHNVTILTRRERHPDPVHNRIRFPLSSVHVIESVKT